MSQSSSRLLREVDLFVHAYVNFLFSFYISFCDFVFRLDDFVSEQFNLDGC